MRTSATAPAKLMLCGEYAVTHGATAAVVAVDRRVRVEVLVRPDGPWILDSDVEGVAAASPRRDAEGRITLERVQGARAWPLTGIARVVVEQALGLCGIPDGTWPSLAFRVESAALLHERSGTKLGLGSSAAVVVALGAALWRMLHRQGLLAQEPDADEALGLAVAAHRVAQGGVGSGADCAASLAGGLVLYGQGADDAPARPDARRIPWPPALAMHAVWTGEAASTASLLGRVRARAAEDPEGHRRWIDRMEAIARRAAQELERGRPSVFLTRVAEYHAAMEGFGSWSGADVVSAPHRALAALAAKAGVAYKPSGAGGGDVGVAFALDPGLLDAFCREARDAGYLPLDLKMDPQGLALGDDTR